MKTAARQVNALGVFCHLLKAAEDIFVDLGNLREESNDDFIRMFDVGKDAIEEAEGAAVVITW